MVREVEMHGELQDHAFHSFEPTLENGCGTCHPGIDEAYVTTFTDEIEGLLDGIATRLGYADYEAMEATLDDDNPLYEVFEREIAYALAFVISDGSMGIHNPDYTRDLLNNAIDYYDATTAP
jgi:hypothetical protein